MDMLTNLEIKNKKESIHVLQYWMVTIIME